ncbi:hypothetical protein Tco_0185690 [Tanacetum coccineum]
MENDLVGEGYGWSLSKAAFPVLFTNGGWKPEEWRVRSKGVPSSIQLLHGSCIIHISSISIHRSASLQQAALASMGFVMVFGDHPI